MDSVTSLFFAAAQAGVYAKLFCLSLSICYKRLVRDTISNQLAFVALLFQSLCALFLHPSSRPSLSSNIQLKANCLGLITQDATSNGIYVLRCVCFIHQMNVYTVRLLLDWRSLQTASCQKQVSDLYKAELCFQQRHRLEPCRTDLSVCLSLSLCPFVIRVKSEIQSRTSWRSWL